LILGAIGVVAIAVIVRNRNKLIAALNAGIKDNFVSKDDWRYNKLEGGR
jgi:hypothetical protein